MSTAMAGLGGGGGAREGETWGLPPVRPCARASVWHVHLGAEAEAEEAEPSLPVPGSVVMASATPPGAPAPTDDALRSTIVAVDSALDAAEDALRPYLAAPLKAALARLAPLDSARLMTSLAFSATSLQYGACPRWAAGVQWPARYQGWGLTFSAPAPAPKAHERR